MSKVTIPQEDADHILAVGHKVMYVGQEAVIEGIRVWHDMGTLLGPPWRGKPVFDLKGEGWSTMNIPLEDIDLWFPKPPMPEVKQPPNTEVEGNDKGHKPIK